MKQRGLRNIYLALLILCMLITAAACTTGEKEPAATTPMASKTPDPNPQGSESTKLTPENTVLEQDEPAILSRITIEIPDSDGILFTLTNIYHELSATKGLEYDLDFYYAPDATLVCNEDIYLFEFTDEQAGIPYYLHSTYALKGGKLLRTYIAGEQMKIADMQVLFMPDHPFYEVDQFALSIPSVLSGFDRSVYFIPQEQRFEDDDLEDYDGAFPVADLGIEEILIN